jgi:hypothetical protein
MQIASYGDVHRKNGSPGLANEVSCIPLFFPTHVASLMEIIQEIELTTAMTLTPL